MDALFFCQNTLKTGNNAVEMSQAFHDIARFERFIDLNLFKCAFNCNVIQNQEIRCFIALFDGAYFLLAVMVERDESSRRRMAN